MRSQIHNFIALYERNILSATKYPSKLQQFVSYFVGAGIDSPIAELDIYITG